VFEEDMFLDFKDGVLINERIVDNRDKKIITAEIIEMLFERRIKMNKQQAIILIGIQASGKTSFYAQKFLKTHIRVSLDMLHTRRKEQMLLNACLSMPHSFVIDNTNLTRDERAKYIEAAKASDFQVIGYYFQSKIDECINRNNQREGNENIPEIAIRGSYTKLELPRYDEGYDELYYVEIVDNKYNIKDWNDEI
jgi:predicted kinase